MVAIRVFASRGILNGLFDVVGLPIHLNMLGAELTAMLSVIITFIWSVFGTNTIIFITGMATLDREIYDAARVDGAGAFATFREITIPMLMRFIQFAFIADPDHRVHRAVQPHLRDDRRGSRATGRRPSSSTSTSRRFQVGVFGYAAAIGVVLFGHRLRDQPRADCGVFRSRLD